MTIAFRSFVLLVRHYREHLACKNPVFVWLPGLYCKG